MKVVVTGGGTREYIDDVRVMTNISSGKLAALIAEQVYVTAPSDDRIEVVYIHGRHAALPGTPAKHVPITTTQDALEAMEEHCEFADVVIHPMAVSDFTFQRDKPVKVSGSDASAFVEYMRQTIVPTPKLLAKVRTWSPKCFLVGFKFLSGASFADLTEAARKVLNDNLCDLVVANDLQAMKKAKTHVAHFLTRDNEVSVSTYEGKDRIAHGVAAHVDSWWRFGRD